MRKFLIILVLASASRAQITIPVGKITVSGKVTIPTSPTTASCLLTGGTCSSLVINGDPDSVTAFTGKADATIRQDANSVLWLAYSWPNIVAGGTAIVETHVAKYNGTSFDYTGTLYPTQTVTNPTTGNTQNHTAHEVANIYTFGTKWVVITQSYLVAPGGKDGTSNQPYTVRFQLAMGDDPGGTLGPMAVSGATPYYLGTAAQNNDSNFLIDAALDTISGHSECTQFREPNLISVSTVLYFQTSCGNLSSILQFTSTLPTIAPYNSWSFSYVNNFATHTNADGLCSYVPNGCAHTPLLFTQSDITKRGSVYLMPMSLIYIDGSGNKVNLGFVMTELASLSPIAFATVSGKVKVDAVATSSDSLVYGPGSSTYDPNYYWIIAHKVEATLTGGSTNILMSTGLQP